MDFDEDIEAELAAVAARSSSAHAKPAPTPRKAKGKKGKGGGKKGAAAPSAAPTPPAPPPPAAAAPPAAPDTATSSSSPRSQAAEPAPATTASTFPEMVVEVSGQRLDAFVADALRITRSRVVRATKASCVLVDGVAKKASYKVKPGEVVVFREPTLPPIKVCPEAIDLDILFEDEHLLVVNKPAGMAVHPAGGLVTGTLVNALLHHFGNEAIEVQADALPEAGGGAGAGAGGDGEGGLNEDEDGDDDEEVATGRGGMTVLRDGVEGLGLGGPVLVEKGSAALNLDASSGAGAGTDAGAQAVDEATLARSKEDERRQGVVRPGIVHRLDRFTSGVMVVAKDPAAHAHIHAQFAARTSDRRYEALLCGVPDQAAVADAVRQQADVELMENGQRVAIAPGASRGGGKPLARHADGSLGEPSADHMKWLAENPDQVPNSGGKGNKGSKSNRSGVRKDRGQKKDKAVKAAGGTADGDEDPFSTEAEDTAAVPPPASSTSGPATSAAPAASEPDGASDGVATAGLAAGRITGNIGRDPMNRLRMAVLPSGKGKHAATNYVVLAAYPHLNVSLVSFKLDTGRTHQIRVHAASVGHPLLGDDVYGGAASGGTGAGNVAKLLPSARAVAPHAAAAIARQALHAKMLSFTHPVTGKRCIFTAPPPPDFQKVMALGQAESSVITLDPRPY